MKTIVVFFVCLATGSFAQKQYIWEGGKPGRANDWNCAANWSTYRVPDEFADVIIPFDQSYRKNYPVIRSDAGNVNSIRIACGARIDLAKGGSLGILNPDYCDDVSRITGVGHLNLSYRSEGETVIALVQRTER
jgi:hypothetical protein